MKSYIATASCHPLNEQEAVNLYFYKNIPLSRAKAFSPFEPQHAGHKPVRLAPHKP